MTAWIEVLTALTEPPKLPLRGIIREIRTDGDPEGAALIPTPGTPPMPAPSRDGCRVWRDGDQLCIEHENGRLIFVTNGDRAWDFTADPQRPRTCSPGHLPCLGASEFLLRRRTATDRTGDDFTRPTSEVDEAEFAGRRCWTVELTPTPPHRTHYESGSTSNPVKCWATVRRTRVTARSSSTSLSATKSTRSCSPGTVDINNAAYEQHLTDTRTTVYHEQLA